MALPVLNNPNYEMVLPSTGEKIEYRPFLVKEQKILMMALESKDTSAQRFSEIKRFHDVPGDERHVLSRSK